MSQISAGTPLSQRVIFNSGQVDFGSNRLINLDNVAIEITVADAQLRRLNSIKMAALKRRTFSVTLRGKVKSFNKEMFTTYFGESSVDGTGTLITFKDGQQSTLNPVFTALVDDDALKPFQCQFTDAVITAMPISTALEEYGEVDFEMIARDVSVFNFE